MKNPGRDKLGHHKSVDLQSYIEETCGILASSSHTVERCRKVKPKREGPCTQNVAVLTCIQKLETVLKDTQLSSFMPTQLDYNGVKTESEGKPNDITLSRLVDVLHSSAEVGTFLGREDCGYISSDFEGVAQRADATMKCYLVLLEKLHKALQTEDEENRWAQPFMRNLITKATLLSGEHSEANPWTDDTTQETSGVLMSKILETTSITSVSDLLCCPPEGSTISKGLITILLGEMRPNLQKDTWKKTPSSASIFKQLLLQVPFPYLSDHLSSVLPPSLLFIDDHQMEYKVVGVQCLHHIIQQVSASELQRQGMAEVMYEALQHQLYTHEHQLLDAALPALYSSLAVVEKAPCKVTPPRHESRYDGILERLLQDMELENLLVLRRTYSRHLPPLLVIMGITLARHMPRLMRVIYNYVEIYDGPTEESRLNALNILKTVITEVWPRMAAHASDILQCLLKLIYDVSTARTLTPAQVNEEIIAKATECGVLLRRASKAKVESLLTDLQNVNVNSACHTFVCEVLADQETLLS